MLYGKIVAMKSRYNFILLRYLIIFSVVLFVPVLSHSQPIESETPEQVIYELQATLIQVMQKGTELSYQERFNLLAPVVQRSHDLPAIIKAVLGTHWNKLTEEQHQAITETFSKLSIATYAERFNQYDQERFEFIEKRTLPKEQVLVRSQLIQADGKAVNFDYVMRQGASHHWKIINILADGVSDLALKRAEYSAIIQRDGFSALLSLLEQKIIQAEQHH